MSLRYLFFSLLLISASALANPHAVITPDCLKNQLNGEFTVLANTKNMWFLTVDELGIDKLVAAKNVRQKNCGGFRDVSEPWENYTHEKENTPASAKAFLIEQTTPPTNKKTHVYKVQYEEQVEKLLTQLNPSLMWDNLTELSNFHDRYANSDNGVKAAAWLKAKVLAYAHDYRRTDVSARFVETGNYYKQPSLVIKIGNSDKPGIVIGAHMDTLSGTYSKKPGADDDGSGSATVLEATRTLLASGLTFDKPIYIVWYAAEEEGLVGSGFVVNDFKNNQIPVDAVLHFDLTGYAHQNEPTMWLITDNVDRELTNYLGTLIKTYVKKPVRRTQCGYACSDHATWTTYGYAASIPAESSYADTNPSIHSSYDTIEKLSIEHMTDYTKLAVAFAVELAEPVLNGIR